MTYIKLDDWEQHERWPDTQLDAVEILGAAMVHCGIYDLDRFYYAHCDPDHSHIVAWDTPIGHLNRCLKQVLDVMRYRLDEEVAA